jgi:cytoskeletal protein CcmA (bactofilin family)
MGLFTKSTNDNNELNAFLGVGTEYRGKLEFVGTVRIDGRFEGEISTDGDLILGREARIIGTVRVGRLTSNGYIEGDVSVDERATLEKTSYLKGSLTAPQLVVQEGAVIEGGIMMTKDGLEAKGKVVSGDFSQKPGESAAVSETDVAKTGSDDTKY